MRFSIKYYVLLIFLTALGACKSDPGVADGSPTESLVVTSGTSVVPYAPGAAVFSFAVYPATGPVNPTSSITIAAGSVAILRIKAVDSQGNPFPSGLHSIQFSIAGGSSTGTIGAIAPIGGGLFEAPLTGNVAGSTTTVSAIVNSTTIGTAQVTVNTGVPSTLNIVTGANQSARVSTGFAVNPKVKVGDKYGNAISGAPIVFTGLNVGVQYGATPSGTPLFTGAPSLIGGAATITVNSDANGFAEAPWSGQALTGIAAVSATAAFNNYNQPGTCDGTQIITGVASTFGLQVGMNVTGGGNIPAGSHIIAIAPNTSITLDQNCSVGTPTLSFGVGTAFSGMVYDKPSTPVLWITGVTGKIDTAWSVASSGGGSLSYTLFRGNSGAGPFFAVASNTQATLFSDIDATTGNFYYYLVANNGYMNSDNSPIITNTITITNIWSFLSGNAAQYTVSDPLKINFGGTGGACQLIPSVQSDNSVSGFSTGTGLGASLNGTVMRLTQTGTPTNNSGMDATWVVKWANVLSNWHLDEVAGTFTDSAGARTGTNAGAVTLGSVGKLKNAIILTGAATSFVKIPSHASFNTLTTPFSISAWVKTAGAAGIIYSTWSSGNAGFQLYISGGKPALWSNGVSTIGNTVISDGNWHFIVGTWNAGTYYIFVDGRQDKTGALTAIASNKDAQIGAQCSGAASTVCSGFFTGSIDEVALWNTNIVTADIQALYDRQSPKYSGMLTSRVIDGLNTGANWTNFSWITTLPTFKQLPDFNSVIQNESSADYSSLVGSTGATSDNNLMSSIGGLWHLNEGIGSNASGSVIDMSGNVKNGTPLAGVTFGGPGKFNNAPTFNGTATSIINIVPATAIVPNVSLSAWVNPTSTALMNIVGGTGILQYVSLQSGQFWVYDNAAWRTVGSVPSNQWTHVALTFNGSGALGTTRVLKLFVNGVLLYSGAASTYTTGSVSYIGSYNAGTRPFIGAIDEVGVWNRILQPAEVIQLYRRGSNRVKFQVRTCSAANCTDDPTGALWKGPNGTKSTYFSEFYNMSIQSNTPSGFTIKTPPTIAFAAFTAPAPVKHYFQYRSILESDDTSTNCNYGAGATWCSPELVSVKVDPIHYDNSAPTIFTKNSVASINILKMIETLGTTCSSGVKYNLSLDKTNWYYWTGTTWALADGTVAKANTAAILQSVGVLTTFERSVGTGSVYLKAFLQTSGTSSCALNKIEFDGQ